MRRAVQLPRQFRSATACKHQLFVLMRVIGVPVDDISSLTVTDMQELLTTQRD